MKGDDGSGASWGHSAHNMDIRRCSIWGEVKENE